ncbi:KRAB-A domain-containing protein 2 [Trichonephila clavipes]|nr:KRAB-A domain-containing protein 2 [Trichonephila clavipes]
MLRTSQKIFASAQIGNIVRVQVLDVNRGRTYNRNVLAIVVGIEDSDFYKLANENGTLKHIYTRNQFVICKEKLLSIDDIYFQEISLRESVQLIREAVDKAIQAIILKGSIPQINAQIVKGRASCAIQSVIIL